ncbi:MAG: dipeptide/oligopeptide/nickel ABC transporter permease/ATP-binding protein [Chloroflexota bacterium]|nr:MAG: dipeptide/oligopeptide/nickel ABC transporter permease/ATP-binding protein [Chloroflexota bacterium]
MAHITRLRRLISAHHAAGGYAKVVGGLLLMLLVATAVAAPLLAPYDPGAQVAAPFAAPSWAHLLGANDIGQDLLSELIYGARVSLLVGLLAALAATVVGTAVGLAAGYFRGPLDAALMRMVDVMLSLPFLPLMIVLGVYLGPGLVTEILIIGTVIWAHAARELRAQVLSSRERGHIQAIRAMGASAGYVLARHLLPAVFPLVLPQFLRAANAAILLESSLGFLGLGDPTTKSWGTMLFYANARSAFLTHAWLWWVLPAGLCIAATVLGFALLGYAMEPRIRPRLRARPRSWLVPSAASCGSRSGQIAVRETPLLQVADLSVTYETAGSAVRAVDAVSFDVRRGEVLGIVGESGCGKSTVAMALLRLLKPPARLVAGRMLLNDRDLALLSPAELQRLRGARLALVPQTAMNALNPVYNVLHQVVEAIMAHRSVSRREARARGLELLALVGIPPERGQSYPHELSGGMRQRVVIAMALANDPQLIIADEPTTGLDLLVQAEILALLADLRARLNLAMIFISHDLAVVLRIADRIVVMQAGQVVERGPAAALAAQPEHPYTRRLLETMPRLKIASLFESVLSDRPADDVRLVTIGKEEQ